MEIDASRAFVFVITGALVSVLIFMLGYSFANASLSEMKECCESSISRNQNCAMRFIPQEN